MASNTILDKKKNSVTGIIKDEIISGFTRNVNFEETLEVKNVRVGEFKLSLFCNEQKYLEGVISDIRFTCQTRRQKHGAGTSAAVFKRKNGSVVFSLRNSGLCPYNGSRTHSVIDINDKAKMFEESFSVDLTRKIDTRSDGWSHMTIEFKVNGSWKTVLYTTNYRTGDHDETDNFKLTK